MKNATSTLVQQLFMVRKQKQKNNAVCVSSIKFHSTSYVCEEWCIAYIRSYQSQGSVITAFFLFIVPIISKLVRTELKPT